MAEALGAALAAALGETLGTGVGLAGAGAAAAAEFGAASSTWRNCSSAVWLTRLTTCCALWPGTETLMMSLPCCWTWASVVPLAFTRFSMIWMACCMSVAVGGRPPGLTARSSTVVPLVRSSPRCTRKFLDQLPGLAISLPRMASNSTTMSAASTASARPGREALLLGGATSRPSFESHAGEPIGGGAPRSGRGGPVFGGVGRRPVPPLAPRAGPDPSTDSSWSVAKAPGASGTTSMIARRM